MRARSIVLGLALVMMAGCGAVPKRSEFLGDMSTFKKVPSGRDAVYYVKPGLTPTDVLSYKEVIIEPVSVILSPNSEHKGMRADEVVAIAQYYREALVTALQDRYPVTATSAPRVLRIRPAITDIHRDKPISPLEFTPVGLALKGVETVTGMPSPGDLLFGPSPFNQASIEMDFTDSKSGERLVAFKDTRLAKRQDNKGKDATWGEIKALLDEWAADVRRVMEHPHVPGKT